jgi:tRNA threonylcarbamoyladenosine modification (KEOPS) complex Cgi121 subunit
LEAAIILLKNLASGNRFSKDLMVELEVHLALER